MKTLSVVLLACAVAVASAPADARKSDGYPNGRGWRAVEKDFDVLHEKVDDVQESVDEVAEDVTAIRDTLAEPLEVRVIDQPVEVTGSVSASVPGTVDVNVVNTPFVVPLQTREPFQARLSGGYGAGDTSWAGGTDLVPPGYRWVVEFLSLGYGMISATHSTIEACTIVIKEAIECGVAGAEGIVMIHKVPTTVAQDTFFVPDGKDVSAAMMVRMYVEEGQRMCVRCALPDDNTLVSSGSLNVSGVLEPLD